MAICLKIKHTDGLRLRQQVASVQARAGDGAVIKGAQWHFEKDPITKRDAEVPRDLDRSDSDAARGAMDQNAFATL